MSELNDAQSLTPSPKAHLLDDEINTMVSEIARLPADSAVRRLAVRLVRGQPIDSIQPLVNALIQTDVKYWRESRVAAWTMGHLALEAQQQDAAANNLLEILEQTRRESMWGGLKRIIRRANIFVVAPFVALIMVHKPGFRDFGEFMQMLTILEVFAFVVTAPISLFLDRHQRNRARTAAARALGQWRVPEAVGALAGALNDSSLDVQNAATEALATTLPALTDAHRGILGAESMANLGRGLKHPDTQIVYLLLAALAKVGTSHAIPYVERTRKGGRTTRIRDAAAEVLQILTKRQHEERLTNQLLRPTSAIESPSDHLLRPAGAAPESDPDRLLRAILQDHREN